MILFLIVFFLVPFVPVAGTLSLGSAPPLRDVPPGDPALRRLVNGIGRRVARLRDRFVRLPPAQRMLLTDLLQEAGELELVAVTMAARVAPAAPSDDPEARTLPQGVSRERTAGRLLEIAAALDDALAAAVEQTPQGTSPSQALSRLRAEIEFARKALPEHED